MTDEQGYKHPRNPSFLGADGTTWDFAFGEFIKNMTAGGLFLETPKTFAVGEEITLTFSYPGYEIPVKIVGEIVWNVPQGLGVKFKTPRERLEKVINASS